MGRKSTHARGGATGRGSRELLALVLAAVWLLGFEVAPLVHLVGHGDGHDHHHGPIGAPVAHDDDHAHGAHAAADEATHCHDGHCHASPGPSTAAAREDAPEGPAIGGRPPAPSHGAHSLQHRGIAVLTPAPSTPSVPAPAILKLAVDRGRIAAPVDRRPQAARARGPPTPA